MNHLTRQGITRKRTPRRPHPSDGLTKAALWERLQEAERRIDKAGGMANDLGRDLRQALPRLPDYSDRAYYIRTTLRDARSTQSQEGEP